MPLSDVSVLHGINKYLYTDMKACIKLFQKLFDTKQYNVYSKLLKELN